MAGNTRSDDLISVDLPSEADMGPAMQKLTDKQRRFVFAWVALGGKNQTRAAMSAGYNFDPNKTIGIENVASALAHNPRVQEAMLELARRGIQGKGAMIAMETLLEIASNPAAEKKDRIAASNSILSRAGISEKTEHKVAVTHEDITDKQAIKKLEDFSKKYGLDPVKVIDSVVIEADFKEVVDEEPGDETTIEGIL